MLAAKRRLTLFRGAEIRALAVLAAVVLADQLSKRAVEHSITAGDERKLLPGIDLVNTRNRGVAFGFLPGSHVWVTIIIAIEVVCARSRITFRTSPTNSGSRAEVTSSNSISFGRSASERAIATRCC